MILRIEASLTEPPSSLTVFRDTTLFASAFCDLGVLLECKPGTRSTYWRLLKSKGLMISWKNLSGKVKRPVLPWQKAGQHPGGRTQPPHLCLCDRLPAGNQENLRFLIFSSRFVATRQKKMNKICNYRLVFLHF